MRKFEKIYNDIKSQIIARRIQEGEQITTEVKLMDFYQVSRPTVSKALRLLEHEGSLVRRAGMGSFVKPNVNTLNKPLLFGLIFPEFGNGEIFEPIISNIGKLGKTGNFNLLWGTTKTKSDTFSTQKLMELVDEYIERKVDGVFFAPWESENNSEAANKKALERLKHFKIPVVLIDRDISQFPNRSEFALIAIDNIKAGYLVANHLLSQQESRIDFMWLPYTAYTINLRIRGYQLALQERGIIPEKEWIHFGDPEDRAFVQSIVDSGARNIICGNDYIAALFMHTLREIGIEIPNVVRIAAFDDVKYSRLILVPLTTIHQPIKEIARKALEAMFSMQKWEIEYAASTTLIDCHLIIRKSSVIP